jgi:hypothetical protein
MLMAIGWNGIEMLINTDTISRIVEEQTTQGAKVCMIYCTDGIAIKADESYLDVKALATTNPFKKES